MRDAYSADTKPKLCTPSSEPLESTWGSCLYEQKLSGVSQIMAKLKWLSLHEVCEPLFEGWSIKSVLFYVQEIQYFI
jgi:hypothetical protein